MSLVGGVDSSTQGCKVYICEQKSGKLIRMGRASHPKGTEVDPEAWWKALHEAIDKAGGLKDVKAISVAGQQHGMVCLDSSGRVVRPALLWNDTRSASSAEHLIKQIGGADVYARRVGIVPVTSFTASKLRWLRENEPDNAEKVAAVCLPHDWLTWRLMGYGPENPDLEALVTDRSDASGTAYWSAETGKYDNELFHHAFGASLREAGSDKSHDQNAVIVPRIIEIGEVAGKTPDGITVAGGAGDNAGGALGLNIDVGDVVVSLGTSGAAFSVQKQGPNNGAGDPTGIVAGFADATGLFLPLVCTLNGARILEAACNLIGLTDPNDLTPLALSAEPGSNGLVLLPYFEGERTPNLPTAKASMHNMTLENTNKNNLARCYIESLLCSMAQAVNAILANDSNDSTSRVFLIGGAAANKGVQEIARSVFNVDAIYIPSPGEYVARGAAFQAAWCLSGKKPEWAAPIDEKLTCKYVPAILEQYEAAQFKAYPSLKK